MPDIVNPRIEDYLRKLYDDGDPVRLEMEEMGRQRKFPIVGPLVGRCLQVLTRSIRARRVFELGSGYGYSALHFARAVGEFGAVVLISGNIPFKTEVSSVYIFGQLQSGNGSGAAAVSVVLLANSLGVLLLIGAFRRWRTKHDYA